MFQRKNQRRWGPFAPIPRIIKDDHRFVAAQMGKALRAQRPSCPVCQTGRLQPTDHAESRRCDACGEVIMLDELAITYGHWLEETAADRSGRNRRNARLLVQIDLTCLAMAAACGAFTGWWSPFIAVGIFSVPVLTHALAFRYRAWQAETGRIFETHAPLGDFVKSELNER